MVDDHDDVRKNFLILTINVRHEERVVNFKCRFLLRVICHALNTYRVALIFRVLKHRRRERYYQEHTAATNVRSERVVLRLTQRTTILILRLRRTIRRTLSTFLPFKIFALLLFLMIRVIRSNVRSLKLATSTVSNFLRTTIMICRFIRRANEQGAILRVDIGSVINVIRRILTILLFTVLRDVRDIRRYASRGTRFNGVNVNADDDLRLCAKVVVDKNVTGVTFRRRITRRLLRTICHMEYIGQFQAIDIVAVLPNTLCTFQGVNDVPFKRLPDRKSTIALAGRLRDLGNEDRHRFTSVYLQYFLVKRAMYRSDRAVRVTRANVSSKDLTKRSCLSLLVDNRDFLIRLIGASGQRKHATYQVRDYHRQDTRAILARRPAIQYIREEDLLQQARITTVPRTQRMRLTIQVLMANLCLFPMIRVRVFRHLRYSNGTLFTVLIRRLTSSIRQWLFQDPTTMRAVLRLLRNRQVLLNVVPQRFRKGEDESIFQDDVYHSNAHGTRRGRCPGGRSF